MEFVNLDNLPELNRLELKETNNLKVISFLRMDKLEKLSLNYSSVEHLAGLHELKELKELELYDTSKLKVVPLSGFHKLKKLKLVGSAVEKLPGLNELSELVELNLAATKSLNDIETIVAQYKNLSFVKYFVHSNPTLTDFNSQSDIFNSFPLDVEWVDP